MEMSRRDFVRSVTAAGAGMAMAQSALAQQASAVDAVKKVDDLNVAVIGVGQQGKGALIKSALPIPGIRFQAVCDIWDKNRNAAVDYLAKNGHKVNAYVDYQEMLSKEKGLDAVIVATPDWLHAEHSIAAMESGYPVYCEKEMSNSLEKAKMMVQTSRDKKKLLQIGHQRRSNPRYIHAVDNLIHKNKLLGQVTHANAQWNRSIAAAKDMTCAAGDVIPAATLAKYGYASMQEFLNWRWYKKYGGGPIVDLGSHQIDIFEWVFHTTPSSVIASGGIDYHTHHEWYDNVLCIFEYETKKEGTKRGFYETLTTSSHGGNSEAFMGENGTLLISEVAARGNAVEKEKHSPDWNVIVKQGLLKPEGKKMSKAKTKNVLLDVRESPGLPKWPLPIELAKWPHQPHLENFFDAVRGKAKLNCPGELGYATAVAVLAVNEAVASGEKKTFKPSDFIV